MNQIVIEKG